MRNVLGWRAVAVAVMGLVAVVAAGADDPPEADKEQLKRRAQQLQESLGWFRVFAARDSAEPMKAEIVQRWSNPTRNQRGDTALVFWINAGRPEALASVYPWDGNLIYESISLARGPGFHVQDGDQTVWSPDDPGVVFQPVPSAPVPAKSAPLRLVQMRGIAETFKVTMTSMKNGLLDHEEMRLLPKPVHRIDLAASKTAHPDLIDGATFAFVQGTDPEAVLMIEAIRQGPTTTYQYAFGRATTLIVEAKLGPTLVWKADNVPNWNNPKLTTIGLGRRLVD